ncbi:ATP-grasp domain-containing protein [Pseudomonas sp. EA_5y_Pfl2_R50]|uniref:ATP-grasp domain-containing protein n=1 Tax=Pseudomonas sp. EA_5y_Pfl2_R50 TaxID=3088691 RepID=UPI0030D7BF6C
MAIVIVEPSSSGLSLLPAANRLGETVYVLSANTDDRNLPASYADKAYKVIQAETNDAASIVAAVKTIADHVSAVIPGFEYVVGSVSEASATLGLPHLGAHAALQTRNKYACRQTLASHAVRVPRFYSINAVEDAEQAALHVGFPAVLKPINGCGSLFVKKVHDRSQLQRELALLAGDGLVDMGLRVGTELLLEEYVQGNEYSIEGYIGPDGPNIVAVTEKILGAEPYFVEMGHVVDALLSPQQRQDVERYIHAVVKAIDMNIGVFHAELRLSNAGPVLMEIAARLGGDKIHRLVEITHEVSLPEVMIRCYQERPPVHQKKSGGCVSSVGFFALDAQQYTGINTSIIERVRSFNGFQEFEVYYQAGAELPPLTDFRGRLGHVLLSAPTRDELNANMSEALGLIAQAVY